MQNEEERKSETVRLLEWIVENPARWDDLSDGRITDASEPDKLLQDFDTLTFTGLYSVMYTRMLGDVSLIVDRVFRKIVAQYILKRIAEAGELETAKEILEALRQEWKRTEKSRTVRERG